MQQNMMQRNRSGKSSLFSGAVNFLNLDSARPICKWLILLAVSVGFTLAAGNNIILNGNFEKLNTKGLPEGWMIQVWRKPGAKVELVSGVSPDSKALKMTSTGVTGYTLAIQNFKLKNKTRYRLSCYAKCENVRSEKRHDGGIVLVEVGGRIVMWNQFNSNKFEHHSFGWRKLEFTTDKPLMLPTEKARIMIGIRNATGAVYFSKLRLEELNDTKQKEKVKIVVQPLEAYNSNYYLCRNFPNALLFCGKNVPRQMLPGFEAKLTLELPETVTYIGSNTLLPDYNHAWPKDSFTVTPFERDNKKYRRYEIVAPKHYLAAAIKSNPWENYWRVYLKSSASAGTIGQAAWQLTNRNGKVLDSGKFKVHTIPEIRFPQHPAKIFDLCIGRPWNSNAPGHIAQIYADYWNRLRVRPWCFNPYYFRFFSKEQRDIIQKRYRFAWMEWAGVGTPWMKPLLTILRKKSPFPPAIGPDGKPLPISVSMWYLIKDPDNKIWGELFDQFAERTKQIGFKAYSLDYEPHAMDSGYSPENRRCFQVSAKLKKLPTIQECLSRYRKQWFDFRVEQHAQLINKMAQKFHEKLPEVKFWLCSDEVHQDGRPAEWCGVDIRKSDAFVDSHQPMFYYSGIRFFDSMKLNVSALKKPCFPLINPNEFYSRYTPDSVIQNIIAAAALGGQGIGFWPHDCAMDGRLQNAVAKAFSLVSQTEQWYCKNKPLEDGAIKTEALNVFRTELKNEAGNAVQLVLPPLDREIRTLLHSAGHGVKLATIFNFNRKKAVILKVKIPSASAAAYSVCNMVTKKELSVSGKVLDGKLVRDGFLLELPPDGLAILKLEPAKPGTPVKSSLDQQVVARNLQTVLRKKNIVTAVKPFRDGDSSVEWGLTRPDGRMVIRLARNGASLGISPETGDVISWQPKDAGVDYIGNAKWRGHLGKIWLTPSPMCIDDPNSGYGLVEFTNRDGLPGAGFSRTIQDRFDAAGVNPWAGLRIEKRITLNADGKSFRIDYRFINPTKRTISFSFRIHNFPAPFALPDATAINVGKQRFTPGSPNKEFVVVDKNGNAKDFLDAGFAKFPRVTGKLEPLSLTVRKGELIRQFHFAPRNCVALYSWSNMDKRATAELATEKFSILPGKMLDWHCVFSTGSTGVRH